MTVLDDDTAVVQVFMLKWMHLSSDELEKQVERAGDSLLYIAAAQLLIKRIMAAQAKTLDKASCRQLANLLPDSAPHVEALRRQCMRDIIEHARGLEQAMAAIRQQHVGKMLPWLFVFAQQLHSLEQGSAVRLYDNADTVLHTAFSECARNDHARSDEVERTLGGPLRACMLLQLHSMVRRSNFKCSDVRDSQLDPEPQWKGRVVDGPVGDTATQYRRGKL